MWKRRRKEKKKKHDLQVQERPPWPSINIKKIINMKNKKIKEMKTWSAGSRKATLTINKYKKFINMKKKKNKRNKNMICRFKKGHPDHSISLKILINMKKRKIKEIRTWSAGSRKATLTINKYKKNYKHEEEEK